MKGTVIIIVTILGIASALNQRALHPLGGIPHEETHGKTQEKILKSSYEADPDGTYSYGYETENGIAVSESGTGGVSVQGRASWTAADGTPIEMTYVANENGYQPTGSHIHPIPVAIARAIEYIRSNPPPGTDF